MKTFALFLALAIALPLGASAQVSPPPWGHHARMSDSQRQAARGVMKSFHDKDAQLRAQERTQILGALTPSSRALLQQVAGHLATAAVPDRRAAATRLDAKLSNGEKHAILSAAASYRTRSKALFQQFHTQMVNLMPSPPPGAAPHAWAGHTGIRHHDHHTPTAGFVLLNAALGSTHGEMPGGMMMHHPGM